MRDLHCHILPGVDDGARNLDESLAMLEAAKAAGITSIVCTPHVRDPYFDYDAMWDAYELLVAHADGFPLTMGFEVNHSKLMQLGMEWARASALRRHERVFIGAVYEGGQADFEIYERTIFELQGMGYQVIIAHPERYRAHPGGCRGGARSGEDGLQAASVGRFHCRRSHGSRAQARQAPVRREPVRVHRKRCASGGALRLLRRSEADVPNARSACASVGSV